MAEKDVTKVILKSGQLYLGVINVTPTVQVGWMPREGEMIATLVRRDGVFYGHDSTFPIHIDNEVEAGTLSGTIWQIESANLAYALGITPDGDGNFGIGAGAVYPEFSAMIVGTRRDDTTVTFAALRVKPTGEMALAFSREKFTEMPLESSILEPATGNGLDITFSE